MPREQVNLAAQIVMSPYTERLLFANGSADCEAGKTLNQGWANLCESLGWEDMGRTPARELYEDGWNSANRVLSTRSILSSQPVQSIAVM